ncbi:fimbrial protein [Herbaspirillum robiniae]|uniref:Fimbrial-type adhesion domain-containing protein n=1 Tax=Herbaspirillum robiniae TaxID=2014887 RepID=A0A246WJV5_9BURK|nr:fimbrial protein [Herbaspirillum robiniae]OWY26410.1 hypothetical protein CEJ42_24020 [Herbaspirillum robiniae]
MRTFFLAVIAMAPLIPAAGLAADGTINISATLTPTTCAVLTPSVAIQLSPPGGVPLRTFTGINSTSTWSDGADIVLDCSGSDSDVYMTFTDVQNPGNRTSTLPLTRASTASGIGVQVARSGFGPIAFGADSSTLGNANQFHVSSASNATMRITFKGRYIQTAAVVREGTANSLVTVTLAYQ